MIIKGETVFSHCVKGENLMKRYRLLVGTFKEIIGFTGTRN
jgi:hypothetical protein